MRDLPVTGKIQRNGFVPIAVGRIHRQRPAAAGVVDQDVDVPQFGDRGGRQFLCGILLHDVLRHRDQHPARCLDLLRELIEQILAPGDADDAHPLQREPLGDRPANPDGGSADDGGFGLEIEVHLRGLSFC